MKRRCQFFLLFALLIMGVSNQTHADSSVRLFMKDRIVLNLNMYMLVDASNQLTIDQVASPAYREQFIRNESVLPNLGVATNTYWVRVTLLYPGVYPNVLPEKQWYLEVAKSLLNVAELYIPDVDGAFQVISSDLRSDWSQRPVRHVYSVFPVTTYLDEEVTLYLKIENQTSLRIPLILWSQEGFAAKVSVEEFIYGFFFGGMLIMLMYNLFVYSSVRDVGYLYYVMYLLGVTYFEMLEVGHGAIHADAIFDVFGKEFIPFIVLFSLMFGVLFARSFLETQRIHPRLDIIFLLMLGAIVTSMFSNFIIDYSTSVLWVTLISSAVLSYMLWMSAYAWYKGSTNAKYFFFAWNFNCLGFITYSLMVNQVLPSNTITVMSAPFGVFFESVILSFALANRIKEIQKSALASDEEAMNNLSKYRSVFDNAQEGMYHMNEEGKIRNANPSMASILEMVSVEEVINNEKSVARLLFNDDVIRELMRSGEMIDEREYVGRDGRPRWLHHRAYISHDLKANGLSIKGSLIDITEVKDKESAIQRSVREKVDRNIARLAASEKSTFLSMMSHEIRTPLTAIIGFSESLQEGVADRTKKSEYINAVIWNSQKLLNIINNILDISKLEAGRFSIENIDIDSGLLLAQLEQDYTLKSSRRGLYFTVVLGSKIPSKVTGDPTRIIQVLSNVCDNAINFTVDGGVDVHVSWQDEGMVFSVRDTGIGISDLADRDLFELRNNNEGLDKRCIKGAGLGLPVSRYLARLMGGDIEHKKTDDSGSVIDIRLRMGLARHTEWIDSLPDLSDVSVVENKDDHLAILSKHDAKLSVPELTGQVLLAEDNRVNQALIKKIVEKTGATVVLANDGVEACERCDESAPDIVLMDINMPNRNGLEATAYLRRQGYSMPIFALTAETGKQEKDAAMSAGCLGVLHKPVNTTDIYAALETYLAPVVRERVVDESDCLPLFDPEVNWFSDELPQIEEFMHDLIEAEKWERLRELSDQIMEVASSCHLSNLTTHCRCLSDALAQKKREDIDKWIHIVEEDLVAVATTERNAKKR